MAALALTESDDQFNDAADLWAIRAIGSMPDSIVLQIDEGSAAMRRNQRFLEWYEDRSSLTYHSNAAIRDKWNKENPGSKIAGKAKGLSLVKSGIKRARERLTKSLKKSSCT